MSEKFQPSLDRANERVVDSFEAAISECTPYLFHLADQIIDDAPDKNWDLIVGDDIGGRLVCRFIRLALEREGYKIPTRYIALSHGKEIDQDRLWAYAGDIVSGFASPPRLLVVSEAAATFSTLRRIKSAFENNVSGIDFGILAAREMQEDFIDSYVGGYGDNAARAVSKTFEKVLPHSRRQQAIEFFYQYELIRNLTRSLLPQEIRARGAQQTTYPLTNLDNRINLHEPFASVSEDTRYRLAARHCYQSISELADGYHEIKKLAS
jgi:hypothetical protein